MLLGTMGKVHPRHMPGRFRGFRNVLSVILQLLLFVTPWINWNGRQMLLLDVPGRKLHLLGWTFWPQETYFLLLLLIAAALTLFFVTSLLGRMWCGYACPQTLLSQAFIMVERFFEGDREQRLRLAKAPWDVQKTARTLGKYFVWLGMSVFLGLTFAGYFYPIRQMFSDILTGRAPLSTFGVVAFFTVVSFADFGFLRGGFCRTMCPYARFQGSMFDQDSLIVGYDAARGEPRGKVKDPKAGDCVDCNLCVQVCPMGIDIRKGLQFECIACAACADACDSIMAKVGRPEGLVRYASENELEGKPTRIVRPRPVVYFLLLTVVLSLLVGLLTTRSPIEMDVVRQVRHGQVFETTSDGRVSNMYNLKLINKEGRDRSLAIELEGFDGAELVAPQNPLTLPPESSQDMKIFLIHSGEGIPPVVHFRVRVYDTEQPTVARERESTFVSAGGR